MSLTALFIRRPVMTMLLMIGILVFGIVSYRKLPVSDLPTVDYPIDQRQRELAGRESGDDGRHGRDAAREGVLRHRRHRRDHVEQQPRQHEHQR